MLIIPIAGKFDWRHPPIITLLLIILNSAIYFGLAGNDEDAYDRAARIYQEADLIEYEQSLFTQYARDATVMERWGFTSPPEARGQILQIIIWDRAFDQFVADLGQEIQNPPVRLPGDFNLVLRRVFPVLATIT